MLLYFATDAINQHYQLTIICFCHAMNHVLHVSCDIQLRICIHTQTRFMSGMKTTQHNVLHLNQYRVGSRTYKHGTPKVLHQISKDAAVVISTHCCGFQRHTSIRSFMIDKIYLTRHPPTNLGHLAGHSRPQTSSQKSTTVTAFPVTERAGTTSPAIVMVFECLRLELERLRKGHRSYDRRVGKRSGGMCVYKRDLIISGAIR